MALAYQFMMWDIFQKRFDHMSNNNCHTKSRGILVINGIIIDLCKNTKLTELHRHIALDIIKLDGSSQMGGLPHLQVSYSVAHVCNSNADLTERQI